MIRKPHWQKARSREERSTTLFETKVIYKENFKVVKSMNQSCY
jgi:hypothetical protein